MKQVVNIKDARLQATLKRGQDAIAKARAGRKAIVEGILDLGKEAVNLKAQAEGGDSTYAQLVIDYWCLSESSAKQLILIGKDKRLVSATNFLPASQYSIYLLTTLTDGQLKRCLEDGSINPTLSQNDVKKLKQSFVIPRPVMPRPDTPRVKYTPKPAPVPDNPPTQADYDKMAQDIYSMVPKSVMADLSSDFGRRCITDEYEKIRTMLDAASKNANKKPLRAYLELLSFHNHYFNRVVEARLPKAIVERGKQLDEREAELDKRLVAMNHREAVFMQKLPKDLEKKLRSFLHPDKHMDERTKSAATKLFKFFFNPKR